MFLRKVFSLFFIANSTLQKILKLFGLIASKTRAKIELEEQF